MRKKRNLVAILMLSASVLAASAGSLKGKVTDQKTHEPLTGATIEVVNTNFRTVADVDGNFTFDGLADGLYELSVRYIAYQDRSIKGVKVSSEASKDTLYIQLTPSEQVLQGVQVVGTMQQNNEVAMVKLAKSSQLVMTNVSAQEIKKTQDSNAGEVIRRVPGVSIIEDKFVMVRGLSQRYNNVWINGGAVPSTEADSRAFSFDIIPSSQIDNMEIIKTQAPEYPADYSGGFILINTKDIPLQNSVSVTLGGNWNDTSHFRNFRYAKGSATDFLGFDSGQRSLPGKHDWTTKTANPLGDLKLTASISRRWKAADRTMGLIAAMNYTLGSRTYANMENNLFGIYDAQNDRPNYLRHSVDDQYNREARLGMLANLTILSKDGNHKYQWKNIFNQLGTSRYTWREGVSAQADQENSAEYYYRSRTTYNTQLTGKHTLPKDLLEWNVGYAYANRHLPDRRRYLLSDALESGKMMLASGNDVSREWTSLNEHIISANISNKRDLAFGKWSPTLRYGLFGTYRTRNYTTRNFIYNWNAESNRLPNDFQIMELPELLSNEDYYGDDKLYLIELVQKRNNYSGNGINGAAFASAALPFGKLNIYAGIRFEYDRMQLTSNTQDLEDSPVKRSYINRDFFPSVNAVYKFNEHHQLRLCYGRSVNRPEFREISPSVYYDFDLASSVQGNTELRNCTIDNADLRYEFYPSQGEQITVAAFYKRFDTPIEWTYTVAGGTNLIYSYQNARSANNYGIELDIKKTLDFIGLKNFSWSFNGSLIKSRVSFPTGSHEKNRPMQGQSPYLINTGIFYSNPTNKLNISLLYNRIGKRIIGIGRNQGTTGNEENARVPDSYEMPRDAIDLTVSKSWGQHLELRCHLRDLLGQKVSYKQFADVTYADGTVRQVEEMTRQYRPGRNIGFSLTYTF